MRKISFRHCSINEVSKEVATSFLEEHHRQGAVPVASKLVTLGLFFEEELLGIAQFCFPRTAEKKRLYTSELLRLCFKKEVRVYRGASLLIKEYIKLFHPADFFTYQDTTGEASKVYEHCGMTLVKEEKKKQYLVAPGKILATAKRKEYYTMASVVKRGPDALLGTSLGEVFSEGKRKTNPQLFMEELGWHVEETAGDRVYEWVNPGVTFYTYKITALDSDKYYYGVGHVKKGNATHDDCLTDGYYGSGGKDSKNKFHNWKKKHASKLVKEVVETYSRKSEAYRGEADLIGDAWRNDALCLNSRAGGFVVPANRIVFLEKECEIHGWATHAGKSCRRCSSAKSIKALLCEEHGVTLHQGEHCKRCISEKKNAVKACPVHGSALHQGSACLACSASKAFSTKHCEVHGEVTFRGASCMLCAASDRFEKEVCEVHGEATFRGGVCLSCDVTSRISMKNCSRHGVTLHQGDSCCKCSSVSATVKTCEKHGEVSFTGDACNVCRAEKSVTKGLCVVHGEVTHTGSKCRLCVNQKAVRWEECEHHGMAKHQGNSCCSCNAQRTAHKKHSAEKPGKNCFLC